MKDRLEELISQINAIESHFAQQKKVLFQQFIPLQSLSNGNKPYYLNYKKYMIACKIHI